MSKRQAGHTYFVHTILGMGEYRSPGLGKGTVRVTSTIGTKTLTLTLRNAIHAPQSPHNLISISRITDSDYNVSLGKHAANIYTPNGTHIATGPKEGALYTLNFAGIMPSPGGYCICTSREHPNCSSRQYHCQEPALACSPSSMKSVAAAALVEGEKTRTSPSVERTFPHRLQHLAYAFRRRLATRLRVSQTF
ncbi:hypothetical protein ONZ45_g1572 [Pleurotus djamor]|nr:hypothetical protein ONZ45_g1572 [Pleurotus djamor]